MPASCFALAADDLYRFEIIFELNLDLLLLRFMLMAVTICKYSSSTDQITGFLSGVDMYADYPAEPSHLPLDFFGLPFLVLLFLCLILFVVFGDVVAMRITSSLF